MAIDRSSIRRQVLTFTAPAVTACLLFGVAITPQRKRVETAQRRIAELKAEVVSTHQAIKEIQAREQATARAQVEVDRWRRGLPQGSAMVWLPDRIKRHFDRPDKLAPIARLNTALKAPELPGYQRTYWAVDLPLEGTPGELAGLLRAAAEIEARNDFIRVLDLAIQPDAENPLRRIVVMNVAALERD